MKRRKNAVKINVNDVAQCQFRNDDDNDLFFIGFVPLQGEKTT